MNRVRERAGEQLTNQKNRATQGIGTIAQAVRSTTNDLREHQHETIAEYVTRAADQLDRLSTRLQNKEVSELLRDAQNLARRQPVMFVGAAFAYERAPRLFDVLCSAELALVAGAVVWFLVYRFCWRRDLSFFHASAPRIAAGIIVGYLPIFFIDEIWGFVARPFAVLAVVSALLAFMTLLYIYTEVERRLGDRDLAFTRAGQIFLLGLVQALGTGLVITGLTGGYMASRNWSGADGSLPVELLRDTLPPVVGHLPAVVGIDPFLTFPSALFAMAFFSFFIGTFLQLLWEDIPITEPL